MENVLCLFRFGCKNCHDEDEEWYSLRSHQSSVERAHQAHSQHRTPQIKTCHWEEKNERPQSPQNRKPKKDDVAASTKDLKLSQSH